MEIIITVGALVQKDGKILLVQEAKERVRGLWNFPAGGFDPPEDIADGARREVKEETGFDVKLDGLVGIYQNPPNTDNDFMRIHFRFKALIVSGELNIPKNEIMDARWFTPKEILAMDDSKLRGKTIKAVVRDYLSGKLYPVDSLKYIR
ncbi:MAG: NUDIX domain-containing protein [Nanoarchaeota archaeon]|nr:NUDIX domain-containing protein [Nanoarchaeota archaeon]MBU4300845.1 NUDIX domain-containing protein [Nanoarchaeota archaeon]MBU4452187.1 NUDIX domain-containing protein [Nanoarchaeota archaeon]MCG2724477.1 NUDIX domain-containing protein [archaeon]